jgi:hypothetical protein
MSEWDLSERKEVPVVLNMISSIENLGNKTAVQPHSRFGLGACTPALVPAAAPATVYAVALARPRTTMTAAAGRRVILISSGQMTGAQLGSKQSAYMTPISATGDGALGPHPAREPV